MTAETAAPTPGHSTKAETSYVVLALDRGREYLRSEGGEEVDVTPINQSGNTDTWRKVGTVSARTPELAVRLYAEKSGSQGEMTLAAVASRYWFQETLKPKTVTTWETAS